MAKCFRAMCPGLFPLTSLQRDGEGSLLPSFSISQLLGEGQKMCPGRPGGTREHESVYMTVMKADP